MPLSRLTQTLPLDFAEAISDSDAAPVGAAFAVFLGAVLVVVGLLAGAELAVFFAGVEAGAGALAGVEDPAATALVSLAAALLFLLFFAVLALVSPAAAGSAAAFASALFFLLLFFEPVEVSALAD